MQEQVGPRVSVIVASHRRGAIEDFVRHLPASQAAAPSWELIVVADYPLEDLPEKYRDAAWLFHPDRSIPAKRNLGVAHSRGEILAFVDDDCRPAAGWIDSALACLDSHPGWAGVEGRTVVGSTGGDPALYREFRRLESPGFRTNNIFYRRSAFLAAGGFDERFTVQREDLDLAFTLLDRGMEIGYCATALVEHRLRAGEPWDLLKNCVNRRFDPLLHKKHPRRYRRRIGSPFPPGIALVGLAHLSFAVAAIAAPNAVFALAFVDLCAIAVAALRRCGPTPAVFREAAAAAAAPCVLLAALIHGSVRFRHVLLF